LINRYLKFFFVLGICFGLFSINLIAQRNFTKIGLLKYSGGGDWYANPTSLPNLIAFCNKELGTSMNPDADEIEPGSKEIFNYPFIHATGHGNIIFSSSEIENLRQYLKGGGFIHFDDNYGMDIYVRAQIKKLFPDQEMIEIPFNHPIYHQKYNFANGVPKIHEHDGKPPKAYGIFYKGKLVLMYTYETDLGDGWEDPEVHKDPPEIRLKALQMGANIIQYVFMQGS
jgi:hypothetical protein